LHFLGLSPEPNKLVEFSLECIKPHSMVLFVGGNPATDHEIEIGSQLASVERLPSELAIVSRKSRIENQRDRTDGESNNDS